MVDPAVPLALAGIVARAMDKNPLERYQSARVFGASCAGGSIRKPMPCRTAIRAPKPPA